MTGVATSAQLALGRRGRPLEDLGRRVRGRLLEQIGRGRGDRGLDRLGEVGGGRNHLGRGPEGCRRGRGHLDAGVPPLCQEATDGAEDPIDDPGVGQDVAQCGGRRARLGRGGAGAAGAGAAGAAADGTATINCGAFACGASPAAFAAGALGPSL